MRRLGGSSLVVRARPAPPSDFRVETFQVGAQRYALLSYGASSSSAPSSAAGQALPTFPFGLSEAEWLVALLALAGHSNAQIAEMRGVSVRTVANQINAVYRKLGVHGRRELAAVWASKVVGDAARP